METDVLVLADMFENFRASSITHYKLYPAKFITPASYAWSAMCLTTGVELYLICDPTILGIFETSQRGGFTLVGSNRDVKANNQHIAYYGPTRKSTYLFDLDAHNSYGWTMVQSLPYKDIKFSNDTHLETILNTADDASTGYVAEVAILFYSSIHEN